MYFIEFRKLSKVLFSDKVLQNSQQFVVVMNRNGEVVFVNNFTLEKLKVNSDDIYKNAWWENRGWTDKEIEKAKITCLESIDSGKQINFVNKLINTKSNVEFIVEWQGTPIENKYLLGVGKDVTLEIKQRNELEELSLVAQSVKNGVVILDNQNRIDWANNSFLSLLEYSLDEIRGKRPIELFSGDDTSNELKKQIINSGGHNDTFEILQYSKYGRPIWLSISNTSIRNEKGEVEKQIEIVTDVTDLKKLQDSYKHILENAAEIIYTTDYNGNFVYVNDTVESILGYKPSELKGQHFSVIIDESFKRKVGLFYLKQFKQKTSTTKLEFKVTTKQGKVVWVSQTVSVIFDEKQNPNGFQAVVSDINEKKNYELELSKLSVVAKNTSNVIVITDENGLIQWVNESFVTLTGYTLEEVANKKPGNVLQGELTNADAVKSISLAIKNKQSISTEILNYNKFGTSYWLHLNINPIFDKEGELINFVAIQTDITERKIKETIIENQNNDILASINYAKRIQTALLPPREVLQNLPYHNSIFYKPKDIIGGDFYWMDTVNDHLIIAVGDCTGHGVPGALMTLLGINGLINSVTELKYTSPAQILNYLDEYIYQLIRPKSYNTSQLNDSIDISIISINTKTNKVRYSLACRPLVYFKNDELFKIEGSKKSVGSKVLNEIYSDSELEDNIERIYLFSDGVVDQFGGNPAKRLKSKGFMEMLNKHKHIPICKQVEAFEEFYNNWMINSTQTDDMVIFGINLNEKK